MGHSSATAAAGKEGGRQAAGSDSACEGLEDAETDEEDVQAEGEAEEQQGRVVPRKRDAFATKGGSVGERVDDERLSVCGQQRLVRWAQRDICRAVMDMDVGLRLRYLIEVSAPRASVCVCMCVCAFFLPSFLCACGIHSVLRTCGCTTGCTGACAV